MVTLSCVQLFARGAHQAPLSIEFFRQEYWSGFLFTTSGDLSDPRIKPTSLVSSALAGGLFTILPGEPSNHLHADLEAAILTTTPPMLNAAWEILEDTV